MPPPITISAPLGSRWGRLSVIGERDRHTVPVRCDCGKEKRVNVHQMVRGHIKSCGCYNADLVRARAEAKPSIAKRSLGRRFGRLLVTGLSTRKHFVNCVCDCGNRTSVYAYSLVNGDTTSCGCFQDEVRGKSTVGKRRHDDLSGQRFGRLLVLSRGGLTSSRGAKWLCRCECGTEKEIAASALTKGVVVSCGCLQKEKARELMNKHGRYKDQDYIREIDLRRRAFLRNAFVEDVSPAKVYERDMGLCHLCGLPVEKGEFHLEHRIPLILGGEHSYENCFTSHAKCNYRKGRKMPDECGHLWARS